MRPCPVPRPSRSRPAARWSALELQRAGAAAALAVSGPLAFHTISPQRYLDTRFDGGGPFPPQGTTGEIFIFDFGDPDYFAGGLPNEVPPGAQAIACNLTVTGGTSGGNLRAFPGNSDVIPLVSNVNWTPARRSPTTPSWARPPPPTARSRPPSPCTTPRPRAAST